MKKRVLQHIVGRPMHVRVLGPAGESDGITRRDFLNGVLIGASTLAAGRFVGGCGNDEEPVPGLPPGVDQRESTFDTCHAIRDGQVWELPAASGELYDCIVIGAGISGLVAAWHLGRSGMQNVLVLEKEAVVGGVAKMATDEGRPFALGAAYSVMPYNDQLYALYEDLGIITGYDADELPIIADGYLVEPPGNNSFIEGQWVSDSWAEGISSLPLPANVIADLQAFCEEMVVMYDYVGTDGLLGFDTPSDASTTDPAIRALDDMSLREYVVSKGWDPRVSEFFDPYCRSSLGSTHDRISAWGAICFLCSEFQPVLSQPGGNAYLAEAIADRVGASKIQTGSMVINAAEVDGEVHVSVLRDGEVTTRRARAAIYAGPRFLARHILPGLDEAGRNEASDFNYTPYIVANVHVSETPAGLGYDNWVHGDYFFTDFIVADWAGQADPASAPTSRPNVLTVYTPLLGTDARLELATQTFEYYEQRILDDLERVLPGVRATVTGFDLYRWGHAMLASGPGFIFGASRVGAQAPLGRILFAASDIDGLPAFENALASGYRAATEALALPEP